MPVFLIDEDLARAYSRAVEMTPGFIDLSFVNRGYEKTEPLMMPKGYHLYAYFRSEAEDSIDAVTNPYNIYSGRGADDLTSRRWRCRGSSTGRTTSIPCTWSCG